MTTSPSDTVGARIAHLRKQRGWTAADLAARCGKVGVPISAAVIANIETGRRDKEGRRRREVSVEELLALALVFNVPPAALLIPPTAETIRLSPEVEVPTHAALLWLLAEEPLSSVSGAWVDETAPIRLVVRWRDAVRRCLGQRALLRELDARATRGAEVGSEHRQTYERELVEALNDLQQVCAQMAASGRSVPEVPPVLAGEGRERGVPLGPDWKGMGDALIQRLQRSEDEGYISIRYLQDGTLAAVHDAAFTFGEGDDNAER